MLHGKKGFDRVVHAFKNTLTAPITWLFHDLGATGNEFKYIRKSHTNIDKLRLLILFSNTFHTISPAALDSYMTLKSTDRH